MMSILGESIDVFKSFREWQKEYQKSNNKDLYIQRLEDLFDKAEKKNQKLKNEILEMKKIKLNKQQIALCENLLIDGPISIEGAFISFYGIGDPEDEENEEYDDYNAKLDLEELVSMGFVEKCMSGDDYLTVGNYIKITENKDKSIELIKIIRNNGRSY